MELVFRKGDMMKAMKAVSGAVGNSRIPILANLLISTTLPGLLKPETDGRIYLAATDLEIGIRASISGHVMESGAVTLPARKFAAMVREMPGSDVHIVTTSADMVSIDCGSVRFRLAGLPADEFPPLIPDAVPEQPELIGAEGKASSCISMDPVALDGMIRKTSVAASREDVQYLLNGIHLSLKWEGTGCTVTMVATDGKRMAIAKAEGSAGDGEASQVCEAEMGKGVIIPIKAAEQLRNMLQGPDAVRISLHESRVVFDTGNTILASRLVEGEYPDYEKVIPADSSIRLTMETQRLLSVARRVGTMANPKLPGVKLEAAGDVLKLSSSSPESGEACEEMPVRKEGGDVTLCLNIRYLMDVLKVVGTEEVMMGVDAPRKPVLIRPAGDDDYLSVIMPISLLQTT